MLYTKLAPPEEVWVATGSVLIPFELISTAPAAADDLGHVWKFDGGAVPDAPYWCVLCREPQWRAYDVKCTAAAELDAFNATRAAWIAEHRYDGVPPGANPITGVVVYGAGTLSDWKAAA